jgi:hypothetical protein
MTIVAATADFNCKEARYARNAVLGPSTAEEGPCPKGTRHNDASGTKINTSKHTALRELTAKIMYSKGVGVNASAVDRTIYHRQIDRALLRLFSAEREIGRFLPW